jgi:dihydroxyacetone kinase-like protein
VDRSASFGIALTTSSPPGAGPILALGADEIEIGVGIHGEPGRSREKIRPANEIAQTMVTAVLADQPLSPGDETIVMLNGLGGTPLIELYILFGEVAALLAENGVVIARSLVGNYVTSLDMAGASLTVCHADEQMLGLWDAPVHTPALRWGT